MSGKSAYIEGLKHTGWPICKRIDIAIRNLRLRGFVSVPG